MGSSGPGEPRAAPSFSAAEAGGEYGFRPLGSGLRRVQPVPECYRLCSGILALNLSAGDRLTIIDCEGRQLAEVAAFGPRGEPDTAALGDDNTSVPLGLLDMLSQPGGAVILEALRRRSIDPVVGRALRLFGAESEAGACASFYSEREVVCIIAAPGRPMHVAGHDPPTDLEILIQRAHPEAFPALSLPSPLAEPRLDVRIQARTALAYEIKAGEYIQVIDVAGRQCSDFLAFDSRLLHEQVESLVDATATRTLMGSAYPGPGLYSKFYDQNMQPLVEVVRDTVGRHDTFALACTAKYYEERGYPGHPNCTDNFNDALRPYGVRPRSGWAAINFFYNTRIDANNVLFLDEPWSRPGDYVLLQAVTDLVCASSACPDDIDPANGWNPTDIHVRVYPAKNVFSKAVAYRMTPDAEPQLTRETAFHSRTSRLTRHYTEYRGYWLPVRYTQWGAVEEYYACREGVVVMDLSPLRKFEILGPDAEALLQRALTRDVRRLSVGQVVYSSMCYPSGGMLDDGTLFRLGSDNFRWIGGNEYDGTWLRQQAQECNLRVWVKSSTDQLHNLSIQGPRSRDLLRNLVWTPAAQPRVDELRWFHFTIGRLGHPQGIPILVSRTGYTGELGFELWCHPQDAPQLWDGLWEAGSSFSLTPLGLEALDMLRIEARPGFRQLRIQ